MIPYHVLLLFFLCISSASSQCPLNLSYVLTLPWDPSSCTIAHPPSPSSSCCQTLTSLYGVAFAQHLNRTSLFRLPDLETSISCLSDFQTKLTQLNLPRHLTSTCFQPQRFVNTTDVCAGVRTKDDWVSVLGVSTPLHRDCKNDLSDLSACQSCVLAGFRVQSQLLAVDGNDSHSRGCFHYTILYAAGVVNVLGAESEGALSCIFGLPLVSHKTGGSSGRWGLVLGSIGGGLVVVVLTCLFGLWMRLSDKVGGFPALESDGDDDEMGNRLLNWRPERDSLWFSVEELEEATGMFSDKNLIGEGQFGTVYKGELPDGTMVAVKEVKDVAEHPDEFTKEVEMISNLKHRNLVPLRGCCVSENQKYLVYDYMENGNLGDHLFPARTMNWDQRKSIILDVANALAYLHYGMNPPIYHRDIKPTNILLDSHMRARVGDFGLARQGESHLTTRIAGTHGYLAPEYALYGQLTEKSDVYSFGILVLEIMSGRKALDLSSSAFLITDWAWLLVKGGRTEEVLDPQLLSLGYPKTMMERFVMVGILCAHLMVALRPTILDALKMLQGDVEVPTIPDRPFYAHLNHHI